MSQKDGIIWRVWVAFMTSPHKTSAGVEKTTMHLAGLDDMMSTEHTKRVEIFLLFLHILTNLYSQTTCNPSHPV